MDSWRLPATNTNSPPVLAEQLPGRFQSLDEFNPWMSSLLHDSVCRPKPKREAMYLQHFIISQILTRDQMYTPTHILLKTHPFSLSVLSGTYCNWRASEASETLSGVYKFELVRYIYMYGGTYAIIVAHATHT